MCIDGYFLIFSLNYKNETYWKSNIREITVQTFVVADAEAEEASGDEVSDDVIRVGFYDRVDILPDVLERPQSDRPTTD